MIKAYYNKLKVDLVLGVKKLITRVNVFNTFGKKKKKNKNLNKIFCYYNKKNDHYANKYLEYNTKNWYQFLTTFALVIKVSTIENALLIYIFYIYYLVQF